MDENMLLAFLPLAKLTGLVAMETDYVTYDKATVERARAIAAEFGLLPSGGSDFHGTNKPDIRVGVGKGNLAVPMAYYEKLMLT